MSPAAVTYAGVRAAVVVDGARILEPAPRGSPADYRVCAARAVGATASSATASAVTIRESHSG